MRKILLVLFAIAGSTALPAASLEQTVDYDNETGSICIEDRGTPRQCVPLGVIDSTSHLFVPKLPFTQLGTGAIPRTLFSRANDTVHLEDFCPAALLATAGGNITICLQNALNYASARGRSVSMPASPTDSAWTISSTITIGDGNSSGSTRSAKNNYGLVGAGAGGIFGSYGSYIMWSGPIDGTMFKINGPVNNIKFGGLSINGNNSAGIFVDIGAARFSRFFDIFGQGCKVICVYVHGLPTTGALNFMDSFDNLYITTSVADAVALKFDGIIGKVTDTWLSTMRNSRVESFGQGGTALLLAFSDNMLFEQLHAAASTQTTGHITSGSNVITNVASTAKAAVGRAVTGFGLPTGTTISSFTSTTITLSNTASATATRSLIKIHTGCGVTFDGTNNNTYPTGHTFIKSAIDSTCVVAPKNIGVNNFIDFGTTDYGIIPTDTSLRGITDQGVAFNGYGSPKVAAYTSTLAQIGGALGAGNTVAASASNPISGGIVNVFIRVIFGTSGITTAGSSLTLSLPSTSDATYGSACSGVNANTGKSLSLLIAADTNHVLVRNYDGTFPAENSQTLYVHCSYISK